MPRCVHSSRDQPTILIVMGVSGVGKSTIAGLVAAATGWPLLDADTLHPAASIEKMRRAEPLTEADRRPWLAAIVAKMDAWRAAGSSGVVACSALRRAHREMLIAGHPDVVLVHLQAPADIIQQRMVTRPGHFMPAALLGSQLATLEPLAADEPAIEVDATRPTGVIVSEILRLLGVRGVDTLAEEAPNDPTHR